MAIALVGSLGTAVSGTTTVSPTFGQATGAGHLLIAWLIASDASPNTPAGWTRVGSSAPTFFYKANCGASETAPTFTVGTGSTVAAALGEYSGADTANPLDQTGFVQDTISPHTVTAVAADAMSGDLVVTSTMLQYSMAGTKTTSEVYNNGATATNAGNNDATSSVTHFRFGYGITTGNASADNDALTFTITNVTTSTTVLASFKVPGVPILVMAPPLPA